MWCGGVDCRTVGSTPPCHSFGAGWGIGPQNCKKQFTKFGYINAPLGCICCMFFTKFLGLWAIRTCPTPTRLLSHCMLSSDPPLPCCSGWAMDARSCDMCWHHSHAPPSVTDGHLTEICSVRFSGRLMFYIWEIQNSPGWWGEKETPKFKVCDA